MPGKDATEVDARAIAKQLIAALGEPEVLRVARESRWLRRLRDITPLALVVACLSTLGASKATWLADILRTFNAFTGLSIRYKPFHNQLRKAAFPEFMRRLLERTLEKMTRPVLSAGPAGLGRKLGKFRDILFARRKFVRAEGRAQEAVAGSVHEALTGRRRIARHHERVR